MSQTPPTVSILDHEAGQVPYVHDQRLVGKLLERLRGPMDDKSEFAEVLKELGELTHKGHRERAALEKALSDIVGQPRDLEDAGCHLGICTAAQCGRCRRDYAAWRALGYFAPFLPEVCSE